MLSVCEESWDVKFEVGDVSAGMTGIMTRGFNIVCYIMQYEYRYLLILVNPLSLTTGLQVVFL